MLDQEKLKKEYPYTISVKEWNEIKKRVMAVNPEWTIEGRKDGSYINIKVRVSPSGMDIESSILHYMENGYIRSFLSVESKVEYQRIKDIVEEYNETYSERDSMTDYPGCYRFRSIVQLQPVDEDYETLESIAKELKEINEEREDHRNSFSQDDYYELAEKYGFNYSL